MGIHHQRFVKASAHAEAQEEDKKGESDPIDHGNYLSRSYAAQIHALISHVEESGHFGMEEAVAGLIGLDPFSVEDELGNGALADVGDDLFGCAGGVLDVDFFVRDGVALEEALGLAAVAAPGRGVEEEFHGSILQAGGGTCDCEV